MVSGLPDFHTPVDIAVQELSEMITRIKKGAPLVSTDLRTVDAGTSELVMTITGQGVIYALNFYVVADGPGTPLGVDFLIQIDGGAEFTISSSDLKIRQKFSPGMSPAFYTKLDEVDFTFNVLSLQEFTFESTVSIKIDNTANENAVIKTEAVVAFI